ncbi:MAG TPA: phosphopantetheine-binding protein [Planctomycetaceae bacterium]|nr:phosphopantetheine-binding protein [Planctomycetaceae bacterium]
MSPDEARSKVLAALTSIAPEADPAQIKPRVNLRDQLDIDSMDFLNFALALHKEFGVDIPERDYPKLATLDGCVDYLCRSDPAS